MVDLDDERYRGLIRCAFATAGQFRPREVEMSDSHDAVNEAVHFAWSINLMTRAFHELAGCFAQVDSELADVAMSVVEQAIADELRSFSEKPPEGMVIDARVLGLAVMPLHEMTQQARAMIQQARQPKH